MQVQITSASAGPWEIKMYKSGSGSTFKQMLI